MANDPRNWAPKTHDPNKRDKFVARRLAMTHPTTPLTKWYATRMRAEHAELREQILASALRRQGFPDPEQRAHQAIERWGEEL